MQQHGRNWGHTKRSNEWHIKSTSKAKQSKRYAVESETYYPAILPTQDPCSMFHQQNQRQSGSINTTSQAAYRPKRPTTEHVFTSKLITERTITARNESTYLIMLDMSKTFGSINRMNTLKIYETPLRPIDYTLPSHFSMFHSL